ncbi:MAG: hypothetical protein IJA55_07695 [Clostridia bacterium]|nr:hypothetical protein [Clostridia bacterium]
MSKKLIILFSIILILAYSLTGCYVYGGSNRPTNQVPSIWVCEDPGIVIEILDEYVTSDDIGENLADPICTVNYEGNEYKFDVIFGFDSMIYFYSDDDLKLCGSCVYKPDSFTVTVEKDDVFEGEYKTLHFVKQ